MADLTASFQYMDGYRYIDGERLLTEICSDRTRGNGLK